MSDPTTSEESAAEPVAEEPVELYGCPVTHSRGQTVIHPTRETYLATAKAVTDDGYIMCCVYNADRNASEVVLLSTQDFTGAPLATIELPVRVPFGHGGWIPDPR